MTASARIVQTRQQIKRTRTQVNQQILTNHFDTNDKRFQELKLDSNTPQYFEVFGEENSVQFPLLIKIPYCEIKDKIVFIIRQITKQNPHDAPDIKAMDPKASRTSPLKRKPTQRGLMKQATRTAKSPGISKSKKRLGASFKEKSQVDKPPQRTKYADLEVFVSNKVKEPDSKFNDLRVLKSPNEMYQATLTFSYKNNLMEHQGLDVQSYVENEMLKQQSSVFMAIYSIQGCTISIKAQSSSGKRTQTKEEVERMKKQKEMMDPAKQAQNKKIFQQMLNELQRYYDQNQHHLYRKPLKELLGPGFEQRTPVTHSVSVKGKRDCINDETRQKFIDDQTKWQKYAEERDQLRLVRIGLMKQEMRVKRIMTLARILSSMKNLMAEFHAAKRRAKFRRMVNTATFRFTLYRSTIRRYGWPIEKRLKNNKVRTGLTLLGLTTVDQARAQAEQALLEYLQDTSYRWNLLKKFMKFRHRVVFVQRRLRARIMIRELKVQREEEETRRREELRIKMLEEAAMLSASPRKGQKGLAVPLRARALLASHRRNSKRVSSIQEFAAK